MEDTPTGQLVRPDGPAWPGRAEAADTAGGGTGPGRDTGRRTGGRRYRAGRPPHHQPDYEPPPAETTPFPSGFGTWRTLGGLFAWCLASCLMALWLHLTMVAGLGFCLGSALAAWFCRPAALLRLMVAVPAVFAVAEILAQLVTLRAGRHPLGLAAAGGTLLTLAAVAPWLFAGTAGALAIALRRGLPKCVRDLRAELRGRPPARRTPGARRGSPARQALRAQEALRAHNAQRAQQAQRAQRG